MYGFAFPCRGGCRTNRCALRKPERLARAYIFQIGFGCIRITILSECMDGDGGLGAVIFNLLPGANPTRGRRRRVDRVPLSGAWRQTHETPMWFFHFSASQIHQSWALKLMCTCQCQGRRPAGSKSCRGEDRTCNGFRQDIYALLVILR